jgi:hypothetical protein
MRYELTDHEGAAIKPGPARQAILVNVRMQPS